jgi:hypothetical protein
MSRRLEYGTLGAGILCIAMTVVIWYILATGMWGAGGGMFDWIGLISSVITFGVGIWLIKGSYTSPASPNTTPKYVPPTPMTQAPQPLPFTTPPQTTIQKPAIRQRFCTNCGQPIGQSIRFCGNCGVPITQ